MDRLIPWRARMLALRASITQLATGQHVYLSTGCLHDRHDYCASTAGKAGPKNPGCCKFGQERCICPCHR